MEREKRKAEQEVLRKEKVRKDLEKKKQKEEQLRKEKAKIETELKGKR